MERQRSTIVTPVHAARFAAGGGWVVTVQRLSAPPLTSSWKYLSASQGTVTTKHETWVDEKKKNTKFVCMYKNITRYKLWYITIAQRGLMAFFFHNEVQQKMDDDEPSWSPFTNRVHRDTRRAYIPTRLKLSSYNFSSRALIL